jgi:hypothetical protein
VIIDNLDIRHVASVPDETDAPLIINPYAVLTSSVSVQSFQTISGRCRQISDLRGAIQLPELALGDALDSMESLAVQPSKKTGGFLAAKRLDHLAIV